MPLARRLLAPYRALLATHGLANLTAAGLVAQLTQAAAGLGLILVTQQATGSFAAAGIALAGFALGAACLRPIQGRLIDRRGPTPVLIPAGLLHGGALCAAALLGADDAPAWTLIAAATLAGASLPAISQSMRVLFARVVPGRRDAAYALSTITQEVGILVGPAVLGVVVAAASVPAALVTVAGAASVGTLWFALSSVATGFEPGEPAAARWSVISAGMPLLVAVAALLGAAIGAAEVAIPAYAIEHGERAASGALVSAMSLGGIAGGLAVGAVTWSSPAATRAALLLAALAAGLAGAAAAPSVVAIGAILVVAGAPLTPAISTLSLVVDDQVATDPSAQSFGWLSTGIGVGGALGSAVAGPLVGDLGPVAAFVLAVGAAGLGALVALLGRGRLAPWSEGV